MLVVHGGWKHTHCGFWGSAVGPKPEPHIIYTVQAVVALVYSTGRPVYVRVLYCIYPCAVPKYVTYQLDLLTLIECKMYRLQITRVPPRSERCDKAGRQTLPDNVVIGTTLRTPWSFHTNCVRSVHRRITPIEC